MKAYGVDRRDRANRHRPGQRRPCSCCIPRTYFRHDHRARARSAARREVRAAVTEDRS